MFFFRVSGDKIAHLVGVWCPISHGHLPPWRSVWSTDFDRLERCQCLLQLFSCCKKTLLPLSEKKVLLVVEVILGMHITKADTYNFLKQKSKSADFVKVRLGKTTMIHLFSNVEKFRKGKLCLFCKPPVWWKTSPKISFERVWDFESSGALKNFKIQIFFWHNHCFWKPWSSKS